MARADFVCVPRLRVRWAEVDMQKIVFNGHYLTYIDTAVAEYWREIGLPYPQGYVERYGERRVSAQGDASSTSARRATTTSSTVYCRVAQARAHEHDFQVRDLP